MGALLLALRRGGAPERRTVGVLLLATLATNFVVPAGRVWSWEPYAVAGIDLTLLAWLVQLALSSNRWWPMGAVAAHLDAVLMEGGYMAAPSIFPVILWATSVAWSYVLVLLLALGTWVEGRRPEKRKSARRTG